MEENILELKSIDGTVYKFIIIATIFLGPAKYLIVKPQDSSLGISEDEALVYKVIMVGNNKAKYDLILDDKILDKVFIEYNKLLDNQEEK